MTTEPRMSDQINTIINILKENQKEIISNLQEIKYQSKPVTYKYQELIDFLKDQGKIDEENSKKDKGKCIDEREALEIIQDLVNKEKQRKCLTKEELISFFRKTPKRSGKFEPPINIDG